jgi:hypothetical protein
MHLTFPKIGINRDRFRVSRRNALDPMVAMPLACRFHSLIGNIDARMLVPLAGITTGVRPIANERWLCTQSKIR